MLASLKRRFSISVPKSHLPLVEAPSVQQVEAYYDRETTPYLNSYGAIIQAARPVSDEAFLEYLMRSIGVEDEMRLLDAGCGVCGPSLYFANKRSVSIDAVTISNVQVELANERIRASDVADRVRVKKGDFHALEDLYTEAHFDRVFFLESLGYAESLEKVLAGAFVVLKPGGTLYIKDFFPVPLTESTQYEVQLGIMREIRSEYRYRLLDLVELLSLLRKRGLFLVFMRRLDFVEDFTNASNFEAVNRYRSYTRAIRNPFQLFEPLELKFQKMPQ